jgi:hypothetical protein
VNWALLPVAMQEGLTGKLKGLYGWSQEDAVFDSLAVDNQEALLLITQRFRDLGLWDNVRQVTNAYGEGGVGIDFVAWPGLLARLDRRRDFTRWFAAHRDNSGGYRERSKPGRPALHILYVDGAERHWAAHFDLYDPLASVGSLLRHIYYEAIRKQLPDWLEVKQAFGRCGIRQ